MLTQKTEAQDVVDQKLLLKECGLTGKDLQPVTFVSDIPF